MKWAWNLECKVSTVKYDGLTVVLTPLFNYGPYWWLFLIDNYQQCLICRINSTCYQPDRSFWRSIQFSTHNAKFSCIIFSLIIVSFITVQNENLQFCKEPVHWIIALHFKSESICQYWFYFSVCEARNMLVCGAVSVYVEYFYLHF